MEGSSWIHFSSSASNSSSQPLSDCRMSDTCTQTGGRMRGGRIMLTHPCAILLLYRIWETLGPDSMPTASLIPRLARICSRPCARLHFRTFTHMHTKKTHVGVGALPSLSNAESPVETLRAQTKARQPPPRTCPSRTRCTSAPMLLGSNALALCMRCSRQNPVGLQAWAWRHPGVAHRLAGGF